MITAAQAIDLRLRSAFEEALSLLQLNDSDEVAAVSKGHAAVVLTLGVESTSDILTSVHRWMDQQDAERLKRSLEAKKVAKRRERGRD